MSSRKSILIASLISYISVFLTIIATILYTPWMISKVGQINFGLYTLANSIVALFLIDFGIGNAISKNLTKYRFDGETEKISILLGMVFKLFIFLAIIISLILIIFYIWADFFYTGLSYNEIQLFRKMFIIISIYSIFVFPLTPLNGILLSYDKFAYIKVFELIHRITSISAIVLVLYFNLGIVYVVLMSSISGIIVSFSKLIITFRSIKVKPKWNKTDYRILKNLFSVSIWLLIIQISQRFIFNITPSLLGAFSDSIQISIFSPASSIESYFYTIAMAINGIFLPLLYLYIKNNETSKILDLMVNVARFQLVILGLLFIGFLLIGNPFILLWLGNDFIDVHLVTLLLLIPNLLILPQQIGLTLILLMNQEKLSAILSVLMAIISVVFTTILSSNFGAIGAALSISIAYFVNFIGLNLIFIKKMKLNMVVFYKKTYFSFIVPLVLTAFIYYSVTINYQINSWYRLFLMSIGISIIYLVLVFVFTLNQTEKKKMYYYINKVVKHKKEVQ